MERLQQINTGMDENDPLTRAILREYKAPDPAIVRENLLHNLFGEEGLALLRQTVAVDAL